MPSALVSDTLRVISAHDTTLVILPASSTPSFVTAYGSLILSALALAVTFFTARSAWRTWRMQYFTQEWGKTLQFFVEHAKYLDAAKNAHYATKYKGKAAQLEYELIARLSIGYVDDVYHLGMKKHLTEWLRGATRVFILPHARWFRDHTESYAPAFVTILEAELVSLGSAPSP